MEIIGWKILCGKVINNWCFVCRCDTQFSTESYFFNTVVRLRVGRLDTSMGHNDIFEKLLL